MENRRTFLKQLGVMVGALTIDPSRLLIEHRPWVSQIAVSGWSFDDWSKNLMTVRFVVEDHPEALPGERYAHYCKIPAQAFDDWEFFQNYVKSRLTHWNYDGSRAEFEFYGPSKDDHPEEWEGWTDDHLYAGLEAQPY